MNITVVETVGYSIVYGQSYHLVIIDPSLPPA